MSLQPGGVLHEPAIDNQQRKLQIIEYNSNDHPTVESKVQKAEDKLFRIVTVDE